MPPFYPPCTDTVWDIIINNPISLDYGPKAFETFSLKYICVSILTCLFALWGTELAFYVLFLVLLILKSLDSRVCLQTFSLSLTTPCISSINTMSSENYLPRHLSLNISCQQVHHYGLRQYLLCNLIMIGLCSQSPPIVLIWVSTPSYMPLIALIYATSTPLDFKHQQRTSLGTIICRF